jgi:uncharacterized RDD family membrane protein YckC
MQTVKISTAQNIDIDYDIASLGDRIVARIIDWGILLAISLLILLTVLYGFGSQGDTAGIAIAVIIGFMILFYDLICEVFFNGQSIGKQVMKIKVISLDGSQPTLGQYSLRWVFRLVDFFLTSQIGGLICIAFTPNKQRIGDLVAGTTLIKTSPRTTISHVAFIPAENNYEPVYREVSLLSDRDISLIHEVLINYRKSNNSNLLFNTAEKIRTVLSIANRNLMDNEQFLQTIINDYNHITAQDSL